MGHYQEWLAACKGGIPAGSNFDYAGPLTEMVLLGNLALRACNRNGQKHGYNAKLEWDGPNLKVTNMPEANEYINPLYRQGWIL